MNFSTSQGQRT